MALKVEHSLSQAVGGLTYGTSVILLVLTLFALTCRTARAEVMYFNSASFGDNTTTYDAWLAAVTLTSPVPSAVVDFETGFTDGQNYSGVSLHHSTGHGSVTVTDITTAQAFIEFGSGNISDSNPIGGYALELTTASTNRLAFSGGVYAFAFVGIDHNAVGMTLNFVGGETVVYTLESTVVDGDSGEFLGVFVDPVLDGRRISFVDFAPSAGDTTWGLDNIMYQVPEPSSVVLLGLFGVALLQMRSRRPDGLELSSST